MPRSASSTGPSAKASSKAAAAARAAGNAGISHGGHGRADGPPTSAKATSNTPPASTAESDAALSSERQVADKRMDEAAKRLFGADVKNEGEATVDVAGKTPKAPTEAEDPDFMRPEPGLDEAAEVGDDKNTPAEAAGQEPDEQAEEPDWLTEGYEGSGGKADASVDEAIKTLRYSLGDDALSLTDNLPKETILRMARQAKLAQRERALEIQEQARGSSPDGEAEQAQPRPWQERARDIAETMGLDDEASGEFVALIDEAATLETKKLKDVVGSLLDQQQRTRIGQAVPVLLKHDGAWGRVTNKAQALLNSGGYSNFDEAFDDAADLVTRGEFSRARSEPQRNSRRRRSKGQPTQPQHRSTPPSSKPRSIDEKQDAVLRHLFGGDVGAARNSWSQP